MIVLDEQLQGLGLEESIAHWYRGAVITVKQLRPGTVIKDEVIPTLLRQVRQPTFVTINHDDFWRRAPADPSYCMVCFDLSMERVQELASLLRRLFTLSEFSTKRARIGKIVSARERHIRFYGVHTKQVHVLGWPAT
jgi:hypothetical protein